MNYAYFRGPSPFEQAFLLEKGLLYRENVLICEVSQGDYLRAIAVAEDYHVGVNDALAYALMKKEGIHAIYSFDKDFEKFNDIQLLAE